MTLSQNADEIMARLRRAEHLYRHEMIVREVPSQLHEGLVRYLVHRIRPGHFLTAMLASDLPEALRRADPTCERAIGAIVLFFSQVAPSNAWGSYALIEEWLSREDERVPTVTDHTSIGGER